MNGLVAARALPPIWPEEGSSSWEQRRAALKELLQKEEFGYLPQNKTAVTGTVLKERTAFDGGAVFQQIQLKMAWDGGSYEFPMQLSLPKQGLKAIFVYLSFPQADIAFDVPPVEEMTERGYGLLRVVHADVTSDDDDFSNGLAGAWYQGRERAAEEPGKIALWAWALSNAVDYLDQRGLGSVRKAVIGFSRLGKTALFAGMMEERYDLVISHNSGCAGAAVNRGKEGETLERITSVFPFWFDKVYRKYKDDVNAMPWDQHFLIAAAAPRRVYVTSSEQDAWSDPISEYIGALAASEVYEKLGLTGLMGPEKVPAPGTALHEGYVAYHMRKGGHALLRQDWNWFMDYMDQWA